MDVFHVKSENKTNGEDKFCLYIGRWQPWHDGHQWLIDQSLNKGKNVLIAIRDVSMDDKNPFEPADIFNSLTRRFSKEIIEGRIKLTILPDIESVNFGRGVGYDIIEHVPSDEIAQISATKIREQMKNK
jgi:nicotinamide mononucleotide adenylyltransferase